MNAATPIRMPGRRLYSRLPTFLEEGHLRRTQTRDKAMLVAQRTQGVGMKYYHSRSDALDADRVALPFHDDWLSHLEPVISITNCQLSDREDAMFDISGYYANEPERGS